MSKFSSVSKVILLGAIAWLFVAGLLVLQFWPDLPKSKIGWLVFIVFGPPLYVCAEWLSEQFWSSHSDRSLSIPSPAMQTAFIISSLVIGGAFVWGVWWLQSH
jgi:hypothetical protein